MNAIPKPYWINLAGHRVQAWIAEDGALHLCLPVLGGEDVSRHPDRLPVVFRAGEPPAADLDVTESEVEATESSSPLLGWGRLDGAATTLHPIDTAWDVDIPSDLWQAAIAYAAKSIT